VNLISKFLSANEAKSLQNWLFAASEVLWQQEYFKIYGRQVVAPREIAWFGDAGLNYRYAQLDHPTQGWPEPLFKLKRLVEGEVGLPFNFLLLNKYADGSQYMGWHRDDEVGCIDSIASLSLGAVRRFSIDRIIGGSSCTVRESLDLDSGSLLVFDGRQRHCLRATKRSVGLRINLTFRHLAR
jgi:alkylated DNA repair dioxygenase AlkB